MAKAREHPLLLNGGILSLFVGGPEGLLQP